MPNIGTLLKAEISRLSRREVRQEVASQKKVSAASRRHIAALKRQVIALERKVSLLARQQTQRVASQPAQADVGRPMRFVAKGFRTLRRRLGLSAAQMAKLLGVSEQSVYNWETKKATPRKGQLASIAGIRSLGKREAHARLTESAKNPRRPIKRRKKTR